MAGMAECRLSHAMREGAKLRPQVFGDYFAAVGDEGEDDCPTGSCALGAVFEFLYGSTNAYDTDPGEIVAACGVPDGTYLMCPVDDCINFTRKTSVDGVVTHLNDDHHWTREAIADFVEKHGY